MNIQLAITIAVIIAMIIGFMSGRFKLGLVAMAATTVLCMTGVLSFNEAYAYFSDSNIVMLGAMFILSGALSKTSLVHVMKEWVMRHSGHGIMIIFIYMVVCAVMTNLSSPLAILSMLLPFMTALDADSPVQPSHLLYPGAVIGHSCQGALPIGTFFLMINALLAANGLEESQMLSVFDYAKVVFVPGLISILYMTFIGWKLFPAGGIDTEQLKEGPDRKSTLTPVQEKIVYVLFVLTFAGIALKTYLPFNMAVLPIATNLILLFLNIMDLKDVKNSLNLDAIFMMVGVLPLGTAMQKTGAGDLVADFIMSILGGSPTPLMMLIAFYIAAAFLTQLMSNTATANIFASLAIVTAMSKGLDPRPFAIAIYAGATAAMLSPTSSPSVAIAFAAGHYKVKDVLKACLPLWILYGAAVIFMANLFYSL